MKVMAYTNAVNTVQGRHVQSKEEEFLSVAKKEQDAVTIGQEARALFDAQIQLQDAPEEIAQKIASMFKDGGKLNFVGSEEQLAIRTEQQARFDEAIEHNVLASIIPHIQTNDKLVNSLKGASQQVHDATYSTISKNFLVRNIGEMTEEQRQAMISLGLEKAQFIADNYLKGQQAKDYMEAMTTIAKFAVNGVKNDDGTVSYAIEKGPLVNAPDTYIHIDDLVKEVSPEKWQSVQAKLAVATEKQDEQAIAEAFKEYQQLAQSIYTNRSHLVQQKIKDYSDWQQNIKNTVLPKYFSQLDKTSLSHLIDDIKTTNTWLSNEFLAKDLKDFQRYLTRTQ
ncbi:hypothetical protein [Lysinibacillus piscis]|uniref:Uncharacterized protein n=1 Tax=Lysinibacillus piscis TaxID=2518931 RepID=A0ABQ5NLP8_9BACI|nr:hypothetical protein [Lysinibacillus sp. KH24]GLC89292.1 hypothetical protein LYSBPC_24190 [Lysinibacillus sp. KH24]